MEKMLFSDCTLLKLERKFGLKRIKMLSPLANLLELATKESILDHEKWLLQHYGAIVERNVEDWNEQELSLHFIGPMITLAGFAEADDFNSFAQRPLLGVFPEEEIQISGIVDGMIAKGIREPEKPYFCLQEYKKEKEPEGDPAAQALAAMLVAQLQNADDLPLYGAYVRGRNWFFIVLYGREYSITTGHNAAKEELSDIFQILKALKTIVAQRVLITQNKNK